MTTQELLKLLEQHQDKALMFEYAPNKWVGANYHITEVKHITVDSVDCGSQTDFWNETIIQLWESPNEIGKTEFMSVYKALAILKKVGKMKPYVLDAEVKFEYSNATFNTAQLFVNEYDVIGQNLVITLAIEKTNCKAKETCGISTPLNVNTAEVTSQVSKLEPCCASDGNCC